MWSEVFIYIYFFSEHFAMICCCASQGRFLSIETSWCMLSVNDIVLVDELRDAVIAKLERWQEALEFKVLKKSYKDNIHKTQLQWGCTKELKLP